MKALLDGLLAYAKLARLTNAMLPACAVVAGFTIAQASDYTRLVLTIVVLVLVHTIVTVWNDIADEAGDLHNTITRIPDLRQSGVYGGLRWLLSISLCAVVIVSVVLPITSKLLVVSSLLLGWAYNQRPVRASHRPVLSIVLLGLAYGAVPFLLGASLGHVSWLVVWLAVGWTMGRSSLSLLKDYKDAKGDVVAKKRTFLLVYGGTLTARISYGLAVLGFALAVVVTSVSVRHAATAGVILGGVAMWLLYLRSRLFAAKQYHVLNQIFHECLSYQLLFDGLLVVCLCTL